MTYNGIRLKGTADFTAMSAIYTHHQYIAGFFLLGAFTHGMGLSTSSRMPTTAM
jgi:hypothetical protein